MTRKTLSLALTLALTACAAPSDEDDGDTVHEPVVTEELGDGSFESVLDATDDAAWIYFDFETRGQLEPADPENDERWDLGALRFNIKSNGGTSGTGGAAVAILDGTRFDAVTAAPTAGFVEDAAKEPGTGGDSMSNTSPGYAFDNWFAYNIADHTLSPVADRVYVVRTPEGNHFKLEMLGYYDDAGTPGVISFRWAALP